MLFMQNNWHGLEGQMSAKRKVFHQSQKYEGTISALENQLIFYYCDLCCPLVCKGARFCFPENTKHYIKVMFIFSFTHLNAFYVSLRSNKCFECFSSHKS